MEPVRIGVVGVGRMGQVHAEVLASVAEVDLRCVIDTRTDVAMGVADALGVETRAELTEETDVEAVVVATPTHTHAAVVADAIGLGLHVLCEKPLTLDVGTSEALTEAAAAAGVVLQLGFWRRFSPPWRTAKDLLDAGAIGRPLMIRLSQWDADPPPPEFCDPAVSGGLAIDCGVHEYDLAEWYAEAPVRSVMTRDLPVVDPAVGAVGDVDNLVSMLDVGEVTAVVDLSRNGRYDDDVRTEILGSDGALFIDLLPHGRTRLATAAGITEVRGSVVDDAMRAGVAGQAAAFARRIRGEAVEIPGGEASTRALRIGMAVRGSGSTGAPVTIS